MFIMVLEPRSKMRCWHIFTSGKCVEGVTWQYGDSHFSSYLHTPSSGVIDTPPYLAFMWLLLELGS